MYGYGYGHGDTECHSAAAFAHLSFCGDTDLRQPQYYADRQLLHFRSFLQLERTEQLYGYWYYGSGYYPGFLYPDGDRSVEWLYEYDHGDHWSEFYAAGWCVGR
jgi:hypothetical protein